MPWFLLEDRRHGRRIERPQLARSLRRAAAPGVLVKCRVSVVVAYSPGPVHNFHADLALPPALPAPE